MMLCDSLPQPGCVRGAYETIISPISAPAGGTQPSCPEPSFRLTPTTINLGASPGSHHPIEGSDPIHTSPCGSGQGEVNTSLLGAESSFLGSYAPLPSGQGGRGPPSPIVHRVKAQGDRPLVKGQRQNECHLSPSAKKKEAEA